VSSPRHTLHGCGAESRCRQIADGVRRIRSPSLIEELGDRLDTKFIVSRARELSRNRSHHSVSQGPVSADSFGTDSFNCRDDESRYGSCRDSMHQIDPSSDTRSVIPLALILKEGGCLVLCQRVAEMQLT
jgi:hypothetical protein